MASTLTFTLPASNAEARPGKVTMVNLLGRTWTFPAAPPEVKHKFPIWQWEKVTRPDQQPVTVRTSKTLHTFTLEFILGYPDGRSIEPDLQQLRGFASDGAYLTLHSYGASLGGLWAMTGDYSAETSLLLPGSNDAYQATIALEFTRASDVGVLLTPIKASSSNDVPLPIVEKVNDGSSNSNDQPGLGGVGTRPAAPDPTGAGAGLTGLTDDMANDIRKAAGL